MDKGEAVGADNFTRYVTQLIGEQSAHTALAYEFLHGAVTCTHTLDGWVHPERFLSGQRRALKSCMAWHPGLFSSMAKCTAGMVIRFQSAATRIIFEIKRDKLPAATRSTMREMLAKEGTQAFSQNDCMSLLVDGDERDSFAFATPEPGIDLVMFSLTSEPSLPGMEQLHTIELYLPLLRSVELRRLAADAPIKPYLPFACEKTQASEQLHESRAFQEPQAAQELQAAQGLQAAQTFQEPAQQNNLMRPKTLLCLGDSITQGFGASLPHKNWNVQLAQHLGFQLINQGIGAQVHQSSSLLGLDVLKHTHNIELIVVLLGENYRYEACRSVVIQREIREYFRILDQEFPNTPIWMITPLPSFEDVFETHTNSCFSEIPELVREAIEPYDHMQVIEGTAILETNRSYFADYIAHPNNAGYEHMAKRLCSAAPFFLKQNNSFEQTEQDKTSDKIDKIDKVDLAQWERELVNSSWCANSSTKALVQEVWGRNLGTSYYASPQLVVRRLDSITMLIWVDDPVFANPSADVFQELKAVLPCLLDRSCLVELIASEKTAGFVTELIRKQRGKLKTSQMSGSMVYALMAEDKASKTQLHHRLQTIASKRDIRTLSIEDAGVIAKNYSHPEYLRPSELTTLLTNQAFLGGFEEGRLCAFAGEHLSDGALGMLEVLEPHRRKGWGRALLAAKCLQKIQAGYIPWTQVWPDNVISQALHEELGFVTDPAVSLWFIST